MREFRVGHDGGGIRIDQHHLVSFGTQRLARLDRKSTRLNSSHSQISYAVFCLKKKKPQLSSASDLSSGETSWSNPSRYDIRHRQLYSLIPWRVRSQIFERRCPAFDV